MILCMKLSSYLKFLDMPSTKSPDSNGYCPLGFMDFLPTSDFCFKIEDLKSDIANVGELWSQAEMTCREQGAQLASLHSREEEEAVLKNWGSKSTSNGLWIGFVAYSEVFLQEGYI